MSELVDIMCILGAFGVFIASGFQIYNYGKIAAYNEMRNIIERERDNEQSKYS